MTETAPLELYFYWYKPRKQITPPPSNCRGTVYGIFFTDKEVEHKEVGNLDLLELGLMTRNNMLASQGLPLGHIKKEGHVNEKIK